jgi:hypothetical protein
MSRTMTAATEGFITPDMLVKQCKRQMRQVEAKIERIHLTYGEEPNQPDVASTLDSLYDKWTTLRMALANARAAKRIPTDTGV